MTQETIVPVATRQIHITYFASLREARGQAGETLASDAATPREIFERLRLQYRFPLGIQQVRVAINDAFADWDTPLNDQDRIAFIPPVAGG